MGRTLVPSVTEIYLCDQTGVRLEALDYVTEYEYANIANAPGPFRIKLPAKFDRNKVKLDNIVEIWRGYGPGTLKLDYCGFLRGWVFGDEAGLEYTEIFGYSTMELLTRRIVLEWAGSAKADMTDYTDDMVKAIAIDQLGADTVITARNLTSVGGGFTVQADLSDGVSISKAFAYKNVLEVCQEVCDAGAQAGTRVYFDIVPSSALFILKTGYAAVEPLLVTVFRYEFVAVPSVEYPIYRSGESIPLEPPTAASAYPLSVIPVFVSKMSYTAGVDGRLASTWVHVYPFHIAMLSDSATPPAVVKFPPAYNKPLASNDRV